MGLPGVILIFLSFQEVMAGDLCQDLFSQRNSKVLTISEQVKSVQEFEQTNKKKNNKTVISDYGVLHKILKTYSITMGEVIEGMAPYTRSNIFLVDAVDKYLQHRLSLLTVEQAEQVVAVVKNLNWETVKILGSDKEDDMTAAYIPSQKMIHLELPAHYKNSLIQWFLFFHEMEHSIQHAKLLTSFSNHNHMVSGRALDEIEFLSEQGAMTAEWAFLQAIPEAEIKSAIHEIKKAKDIHPSYKGFFLRAFGNAKKSLAEYLEAEHSAGRYSRESIIE